MDAGRSGKQHHEIARNKRCRRATAHLMNKSSLSRLVNAMWRVVTMACTKERPFELSPVSTVRNLAKNAVKLWICRHSFGRQRTIITFKSSIHRHHKCDACLSLCLLSFRHLLFRFLLTVLRLPWARNEWLWLLYTYLVSVRAPVACFSSSLLVAATIVRLTNIGSRWLNRAPILSFFLLVGFVSLRVLCICFCLRQSL